MKELSIEEKAKAYDEALKVAKDIKNGEAAYIPDGTPVIEAIFPELKESEDERIRKTLIKYFRNCVSLEGINGEDISNWLERQGEQKPAEEYNITGIGSKNAQGKLGEMIKNLKSTDKVEPKFKVGDWVVIDGEVLHIKEVTEDGYFTDEGGLIPFRNEKEVHIWTIQDAKDGDVLFYDSTCGFTFIYNGINPKGALLYSYIESNDGSPLLKYNIGKPNVGIGYVTDKNIYPATKEQRGLLFQKMHEAGYEWDAEKKELKKIESKPAWSEEDEKMIQDIINDIAIAQEQVYCKSRCEDEINWLKSLKDRVQPKQEWSEEDKAILEKCIGAVKVSCYSQSFKSEAENWLKSLRPQSQWKPSDEQMKALADALSLAKNCGEEIAFDLRTLHEQLKKLMEE